jgi:hypothetical protein
MLLSFYIFSCTGNILSDVASKSNDEDYLYQAQQKINEEDFDGAIDLITTKMSTSSQASVAARETLASAYGGKCGLIFMDYVTALSAATTGSAMVILKTPFVGKAVDPTSCRSALITMDQIGPFANRTVNQNFFTAILGMVLMGSSLRGHIDNSPAEGDGVNDVNICSGITDAQIDDIIIGFGYMSQNISAVSSSAIGSGSLATLTGATSTCQAAGIDCEVTDPSLITGPARDFFRDLTNTQEYGVGSFSTGGDDLLISGSCP